MKFSEKLIVLRKQNGWSQEELAEKLDVSRQAISKWESGQSLPESERIVQLAKLFGVTTDYLLIDGQGEEPSPAPPPAQEAPHARRVSLREAEEYLHARRKASFLIAAGVALCVAAAIPLLLLIAATTTDPPLLSETAAVCAGIVAILVFVASAVGLFLLCGFRSEPYRFLENGAFSLDADAQEAVRDAQKRFRTTYAAGNIAGIILCILSPTLIIASAFAEKEYLIMLSVCALLLIVSVAVYCFVLVGVRWMGMQRLLKEGEYADTPMTKKQENRLNAIMGTYWCAVTAGYLLWSFLTKKWGSTWIIWPIAGVISAVIHNLCRAIMGFDEEP